jgi:hypothetical protein
VTHDPNRNPRSRLRNILSEGEIKEDGGQTVETVPNPLSRLPKARTRPLPATPRAAPAPEAADSLPSPARARELKPPRFHFGPAFWTVTGILSLLVNGILIALVLYLASSLASMQMTASDAGANILSGLYTNFEKMDRSSITSSIPVDTQVPLNITVPVQKTTTITLASAAVIQNARVRISTSALNIDAPAQVTLPAGTPLDVSMTFDIPVQTTIPVHLDVPVNIPLSQTQLHEPFTGLQEVIRPFYCLIEPNALNLDGQPVCR